MTIPVFLLISLVLLGAAASALVLRNPVHVALAAAVTFVGLGAAFLGLGAEFVGLAQWMVYVGAIAILIVFVILLTRPEGAGTEGGVELPVGGALASLAVLVGLGICLASSPSLFERAGGAVASAPIREIGIELVGDYVIPLQALALLLTAALIGAVVFVGEEKPGSGDSTEGERE